MGGGEEAREDGLVAGGRAAVQLPLARTHAQQILQEAGVEEVVLLQVGAGAQPLPRVVVARGPGDGGGGGAQQAVGVGGVAGPAPRPPTRGHVQTAAEYNRGPPHPGAGAGLGTIRCKTTRKKY